MRVTQRGMGLVVAMVLGAAGCAPALIGAGAVGGYAVSKNSVTDYFDATPSRVYAKALAVAGEMGTVTLQDETHGLIELSIDKIQVAIQVTPITEKTVRLQVKARNQFYLPKISTAQDVYAAISKEL